MPFQVTFCGFRSGLNPIEINRLNDIISPCATSFTVTAVISSGNPAGHSFLWEQHSGGQVIFTTPLNGLSVSFNLLDSTDKVFYFWIDKNTSLQQLQIFNYWGTATDLLTNDASNAFPLTNDNVIVNGSPTCSSIIGAPVFNIIPIINPANFVLTWQLPSNAIGLKTLGVEQLINGIWVEVLTLLPTDPQILPNITNLTWYRIKTIYEIDTQLYSQHSCPVLIQLNVANFTAYADEIITPEVTTSLSNTNANYYSLLNTDSVTNELVDVYQVTGTSGLGTPQTVLYTLISTDSITNELVDVYQVTGTSGLLKPIVVYFNGTVIGG